MIPFVSDEADSLRVLYSYGPLLTYCAGDRIVANGYKCPHCGSYDSECGSPRKYEESIVEPLVFSP